MKRLHWIARAAALLAGAAALLGGARPAHADVAIAGDLDVALPVGQTMPQSYLATGAGFDVRLGYRFRVPYQPLWIIPEVAAGFTDLYAHVIRLRPGVRIAFGRFVMPYADVHLGWGWTSFDPAGAADAKATPFVSSSGLELDARLGVDFAVLRRLLVGGHLGYNVVNVGQVDLQTPEWRAKWLSLGLTATFLL